MLPSKPVESAPDYVNSVNPTIAENFHTLRQSLYAAGPIDFTTRELIMIAVFATAGYEMPFKNHAVRLAKAGVPLETARQAVLITFASTTTMVQLAAALSWLDDVYAASAS